MSSSFQPSRIIYKLYGEHIDHEFPPSEDLFTPHSQHLLLKFTLTLWSQIHPDCVLVTR